MSLQENQNTAHEKPDPRLEKLDPAVRAVWESLSAEEKQALLETVNPQELMADQNKREETYQSEITRRKTVEPAKDLATEVTAGKLEHAAGVIESQVGKPMTEALLRERQQALNDAQQTLGVAVGLTPDSEAAHTAEKTQQQFTNIRIDTDARAGDVHRHDVADRGEGMEAAKQDTIIRAELTKALHDLPSNNPSRQRIELMIAHHGTEKVVAAFAGLLQLDAVFTGEAFRADLNATNEWLAANSKRIGTLITDIHTYEARRGALLDDLLFTDRGREQLIVAIHTNTDTPSDTVQQRAA